MLRTSTYILAAAYLLGMAAVGLPFWVAPYRSLSVPGGVMGPGLVVVVVLAAWLRAGGTAGFWVTLNVMAWTLPGAVLARAVVETQFYPDRHNLWPIAMAMVAVPGYAAAGVGVLIGQAVVWGQRIRAGGE